jgi:hypothetical protein
MNEVKNYITTRAEGFESNTTGWFSAQALNNRTSSAFESYNKKCPRKR